MARTRPPAPLPLATTGCVAIGISRLSPRHCEERSDEAIQLRAPAPAGLLRFACNDGLELHAEAEEDLPRIAVEGGDNPFLAEAGDDVAVGRPQGHAGARIHGQELVARRDILLVEDVLGVEADRPAVVAAGPDEVAAPQGVAGLIEERAGSLELEGLRPPRQGRVDVERATP